MLDGLEESARERMSGEGIVPARQRFEFSLDVRHRGQINEVEVALPWKRVPATYETRLRSLFVERYEKLYGRGSALKSAQLDLDVWAIPRDAMRKPRSIWWSGMRKTPVYDGEKLAAGNTIKGPAIVETSDTTVVVHPRRTLRVDALGNFEIEF